MYLSTPWAVASSVSTYMYVHVCVPVYVGVHTHACSSEDNLINSPGTNYILCFLRQGVSTAWSSPIKLILLARKAPASAQGFSRLQLSSTGITGVCHYPNEGPEVQPQVLMLARNISLTSHFPSLMHRIFIC